jgi:hypothetical protein
MSMLAYVPPPIPAELPEWILALKPPDADLAAAEPMENAVFLGLDAELESLLQSNPEDVEWLAEVADQPTPIMSRDQAASILEGQAKPAPLPRPVRRKRYRKMRQEELLVLDAMLMLMILAVLALLFILKLLLQSP